MLGFFPCFKLSVYSFVLLKSMHHWPQACPYLSVFQALCGQSWGLSTGVWSAVCAVRSPVLVEKWICCPPGNDSLQEAEFWWIQRMIVENMAHTHQRKLRSSYRTIKERYFLSSDLLSIWDYYGPWIYLCGEILRGIYDCQRLINGNCCDRLPNASA